MRLSTLPLIALFSLAACSDMPTGPGTPEDSAPPITSGAGNTGGGAPSTEPSSPPPAPAPSGSCAVPSGAREVNVASASALSSALKNAQPGDFIRLSDGTYSGQFSISSSGTSAKRITLCGSSKAVLRGGSSSTGYGLRMEASYWNIKGVSITNSQFGVYLTNSNHNVIDGITVEGIGQEGIHLRTFSSDNVIQNSRIRNTGLKNAEYGEGVYIGTYRGQWSTYTGGRTDTSDRNQVLNNTFGPNIRSEHIDVKEGTSGGVIRGNTFDGSGMVQSQSWVNSLLEMKGNGYTVSNNRGTATIRDGFEVFEELSGWGVKNVFTKNAITMSGANGYAIRVISGNTVRCDNTASGGTLTNVSCS